MTDEVGHGTDEGERSRHIPGRFHVVRVRTLAKRPAEASRIGRRAGRSACVDGAGSGISP